jgi:predicted small lipoprotein YifL
MPKKQINQLLVFLLLISIAGCADLYLPPQKQPDVPATNKMIFVDPYLARFMGTGDHVKLQSLVATAQPRQEVTWRTATGAHIKFTSLGIFVNAEGQGCRNYQLILTHGFFQKKFFNYTACRDYRGYWQIKSS